MKSMMKKNDKSQEKNNEELLIIEDYTEQDGDTEAHDLIIKQKKKEKLKKWGIRSVATLLVLVVLYLTAVYSHIPFIEKWRTIYIETAMSTMNHKWLATYFIPKSVIDEVMAKRQAEFDKQANLSSSWGDKEGASEKETEVDEKTLAKNNFYEKYWELDTPSIRDYLEANMNLTLTGYDSILIEDLEGNLGLTTACGDSLLVLDTANNVMIIGVKGEQYVGKLAIVKNPDQVELIKASSFGSMGEMVEDIGAKTDSVIAINGSAFVDPKGHGSGGSLNGVMLLDGEAYGTPKNSYWKLVGMKKDNRMYISNYYQTNDVSNYKWGIEFYPALIVDGQNVVDGTFGMGLQPRTSIGQSTNGDVMMLIIDGRKPGYSIGCTVAECSRILANYKAYQAMNLDGGSSSVMWYRGNLITRSSSVSGRGRYVPSGLVIRKATDVTTSGQTSVSSYGQQ